VEGVEDGNSRDILSPHGSGLIQKRDDKIPFAIGVEKKDRIVT
jgi:hypothetical protein